MAKWLPWSARYWRTSRASLRPGEGLIFWVSSAQAESNITVRIMMKAVENVASKSKKPNIAIL